MTETETAVTETRAGSAFGRRAIWLVAAAAALWPWLVAGIAEDVPVLWWAARSFGFVSYVALWLAMFLGVLVGMRGLDGWLDRKLLMELHEQWTLGGVIATALHVLAIVTNEHAGVGVAASIVPFIAEEQTAAVGLGVIAMWLFGIVAVSSWLRARLSYGTWRGLHALAFGAFVIALAHAVSNGTDTGARVVSWLYVGSGSLLGGAILTRVIFGLPGAPRASEGASRPR